MSVRLIFNSVWRNPGNYGHRISRLGRAAAWQLEKHIAPKPKEIRLPNNRLFVAHPDCVVSSALIYAEWPEFNELQFVRRMLKPDDLIIDVGANVGHISLLLSDIVGADNIFAFEPTPVSFQRLVENWRVNNWPTENLFQMAVGASSGLAHIPDTTSPETKNSITSANGTTRMVSVPMVSLDDYRIRWRGRQIGLLKIDVEGYEPEVFAGAQEFLRKDRPRLVMFESLAGVVDREIAAILLSSGYELFQLDRAGKPDFSTCSAQNLFALPKEERSSLSKCTGS
jgi:FkbM family methyltransferase